MSAEKHHVSKQKLTLSSALRSGHRIKVIYKDGNLITSFHSKDNQPIGIPQSMAASEVLGIADDIIGQYIDIGKLQTGHKYIFLGYHKKLLVEYCYLICKLKDTIISQEKVLLRLISKYEKMQQEKANDKKN